jgi:hypothetical protein
LSDRTTTSIMRDPFLGKDVVMSDDICDRLRGRYANGPLNAEGQPEFGWNQMPQKPIQLDAADRIEQLEGALAKLSALLLRSPPADLPTPVEGDLDRRVVLRMPSPEEATELADALAKVREGNGALLGPEPQPRGELLGW